MLLAAAHYVVLPGLRRDGLLARPQLLAGDEACPASKLPVAA